MDVTVCICTFDRYELLQKAIDSVLLQRASNVEWELLVIDNSPSAEAAADFASRYEASDRVIFHYEPTPGLSNARNVGIRKAKGDVISYLDDDAIAGENWLFEVNRAFAAFPEAGVVGGRIEPFFEVPRPEWLGDRFLGAFSVIDWGGDLRIASAEEWLAGANISFRIDPLRDVGGFPTKLGRVGGGSVLMSNEEIQVLEGLEQKGWKRVYAPDASVQHLVPASRMTQSWLKRRFAWQAISDFIKNADQRLIDGEEYWNGIVFQANKLGPKFHTHRGLYQPSKTQEEFDLQVGLVYNSIMAMLNGYVITEDSD